jgi:hypothetical protein
MSNGSDDVVTTPGGPRSRGLVHEVGPGEAVAVTQGAAQVVAHPSDDVVVTPGGPRHRSLVHRVEPGQAVDVQQAAVHVRDVTTQALVATHAIGEGAQAATAAGAAFARGWITFAGWMNQTGRPIASFTTTWTVPPQPPSQDGQLLYLFNGIEPADGSWILQPVLQWGQSPAGGGNSWAVASWFVEAGPNGHAFHTTPVQVNTGDTLVGVMTLAGASANGVFNYESSFDGIPGTTLPAKSPQQLVWCVQTLEAYGIQQCSDYPAGMTAFGAIEIADEEGDDFALEWAAPNDPKDCGQHTVVVSNANPGGEVDIAYSA